MTDNGQTEIYGKRWLVAGTLAFLGMSFSFTFDLLGVLNTTLSAYFQLTPQIVDWFALSATMAVVVTCIPIGLYASFKPLHVKAFAIASLLIHGVAFFIVFGVVFFQGYPYLIPIAQFMGGIACAIFFPLTGLANTMWFPESEQGTVYGIAFSSIALGDVMAALISTTVLKTLQDKDIEDKAKALSYIYAVTSAVGFVLLVFVAIFLPKVPASPPSRVEAERRNRIARQEPTGWSITVRKFFTDFKIVFSSRTSIILLLGIALDTSVIESGYLLLPPILDTISNNTFLENITAYSNEVNEKKPFTILWYSFGSVFGGAFVGILLDRTKSYRPLVAVVAPAPFVASVMVLAAYVISSNVLLYVFLVLFGLSLCGVQAFSLEILKQYIYPKVGEASQSVTMLLLNSAFVIIVTAINRAIMKRFGNLYFYVTASTICATFALMLLGINPTLNRHKAERVAFVKAYFHSVDD